MYKVMLVDDERVILEGMSLVVDWEAVGAELVDTAKNGLEALDKMSHSRPDVVITDISMPGLDGLGLIEQASAAYPRTRFIMLSGYKEFDYARRAMRYGVKHYLLKPCNENQIQSALAELLQERRRMERQEIEEGQIKQRFQRVLPHVKEQVLLEFITNRTYGPLEVKYYQELFNLELEDHPIRLLLLRIAGGYDYGHLFALKNIARDLLPNALMSTTLEGNLLLLLSDHTDLDRLKAEVDLARNTFTRLYKLEVTAVLSEADRIVHSRQLYKQALLCLDRSYGLDGGRLIIQEDTISSRHTSVVEKMIEIVTRHYREANLTLNGVAQQMLYMNPDYLGKMFKKGTGENFSHYLNRYRIERACEQIRRDGDVKIFELAENYGFGGNAPYFSQVFKKWTGMTPTEYRKCETEER
ncbi:putative transcriptional regulatory protein YesN [Paenibacillus faecis]|uniref:response regulator transcription factor n=1 Tax=Paenibacillus faecis TaxID=862114 RepID=UPI001B2710AD|nr:response regulator [Paenibacillus faecis]GIO87345.1 putative transcriptional regulatory protein YesN [Paenibacillus faecis]